MRAVVFTEYGPPEVLHLIEVEKPAPKDDEILIRIHATVVTRTDTSIRGLPMKGNRKTRRPVHLGTYLAGEVEAVGKRVKRFKVGDKVFGGGKLVGGCYSEYKCLSEKRAVFPMPSNLTYEEAVAIPSGGMTALPFLKEKGRIHKGDKVLIYGASGGIGTAAIQLAKHFGTEVTGVCSTANMELMRSLGASKVIDYTKEDFTKNGELYDIIFDTVGKITYPSCKGSLAKGGIYLSSLPKLVDISNGIWTFFYRRRRARFAATALRSKRKKRKDMGALKELAGHGDLRPVIDRRYSLEQIVEAHRYVEQGHKKGNVVITIVTKSTL